LQRLARGIKANLYRAVMHSGFGFSWRGYALAFVGAIAFSGKTIVAKLLYRHGIDALAAVALRMALAWPFFIAMAWWGGRGKAPMQSRDRVRIAVLGFTGYYLASVLDVYSRRIVGWALENHLRTELMLSALDRAYAQRHPQEVVHHSDQGTQYTSIAFGNRCRELRIRPSMGSVGDCFDNAMAESFFATLECELLAKHSFKTHAQARLMIFEYLEGFYNPHRLHSSLGYVSPVNFERRCTTQAASNCTLPPVH